MTFSTKEALMGIRQYELGKKHALAGIRCLAHRKLRPYDSARANKSYINGYYAGAKERMAQGKKLMDYSQSLNNQNFASDEGKSQ
jgi:hypothetical protein